MAANLRRVITRTARTLRQEAHSDLTPTALAVLGSIDRLQPVTPTGLAEAEQVQRPTITRVIKHLEQAGVIERTPDPEDGRSCLLTITSQGATYLEEHRRRKSAYLVRLLDGLAAEDAEALARAAEILTRALGGAAGESGIEGRS